MAKKIKVPGYSKKTIYDGNIEYNDYSPDLVGLQLTNNGGTTLFTMGNFTVTTNLEPKLTKNYVTNNFSKFYSLSLFFFSNPQNQISQKAQKRYEF